MLLSPSLGERLVVELASVPSTAFAAQWRPRRMTRVWVRGPAEVTVADRPVASARCHGLRIAPAARQGHGSANICHVSMHCGSSFFVGNFLGVKLRQAWEV